MDLGAEAIARAVLSSACVGTATLGVVSEWTIALLGVPLIVVLAALAGVALVVSYQPHQAALRLWTTIGASVVVACSAAVFSIEYAHWPKGAAAFTAAAAAVLLQIFVPWLIARGPELLDRLALLLQQRLGGK